MSDQLADPERVAIVVNRVPVAPKFREGRKCLTSSGEIASTRFAGMSGSDHELNDRLRIRTHRPPPAMTTRILHHNGLTPEMSNHIGTDDDRCRAQDYMRSAIQDTS